MEAVAAELAGPAASLADPLQQAVLVGVTHRAVTPTRVQQVALRTGERAKVRGESQNTREETKQRLQQKQSDGAEGFILLVSGEHIQTL